MEINLSFQGKIIYILELEKEWNKLHQIDKETFIFVYAKTILDNFQKRLPKKYSLILFFYDVLDYSIKDYEETEQYEYCQILLQIKNVVQDSEKRSKIGHLNEEKGD